MLFMDNILNSWELLASLFLHEARMYESPKYFDAGPTKFLP